MRRIRFRALAGALVAALLVIDSAPLAQGPEGTATVRGRVIDGTTGKPLGRLPVSLSPRMRRSYAPGLTPEPPNRSATTAADGTFEITRVAAGDYTVYGEAGGDDYLSISYGQQSPRGPAKLLVVSADVSLDITIKAWRGATIEGEVFDERGRPVVGANVRVFAEDPNAYASTNTNDRGAYRLTRLAPGNVAVGVAVSLSNRTVSARPEPARLSGYNFFEPYVMDRALRTVLTPRGAPFPAAADDGRTRVYESAFAGGAATRSAAQIIRLATGETRQNVDITMTAVRGTRVSGVVSSPGRIEGTILTLTRQGTSRLVEGSIDATAAADGTFVFVAVPPGQYTLTGYRREPPLTEVTIADGAPLFMMDDVIGRDPDDLSLTMPFAVGDADIDGVSLTLRAGTPITGGAVDEDGSLNPSQMRIALVALGTDSRVDDRYVQLARDGSFSMRARPGSYRILSSYGADWKMLKTTTVNGVELGDEPLAIGSDPIADLRFTFGRHDTAIGGAVVDAAGRPSSQATVLIFPVERERWFRLEESPRGRVVQVTTGTYRAPGLPPDDYYVVALEAFQGGLSRSLIEPLIPSATRVTVRPGTPQNVPLRIAADR